MLYSLCIRNTHSCIRYHKAFFYFTASVLFMSLATIRIKLDDQKHSSPQHVFSKLLCIRCYRLHCSRLRLFCCKRIEMFDSVTLFSCIITSKMLFSHEVSNFLINIQESEKCICVHCKDLLDKFDVPVKSDCFIFQPHVLTSKLKFQMKQEYYRTSRTIICKYSKIKSSLIYLMFFFQTASHLHFYYPFFCKSSLCSQF